MKLKTPQGFSILKSIMIEILFTVSILSCLFLSSVINLFRCHSFIVFMSIPLWLIIFCIWCLQLCGVLMLNTIYYMQTYGQKLARPLLSIFSCNVKLHSWICGLKHPSFPPSQACNQSCQLAWWGFTYHLHIKTVFTRTTWQDRKIQAQLWV